VEKMMAEGVPASVARPVPATETNRK